MPDLGVDQPLPEAPWFEPRHSVVSPPRARTHRGRTAPHAGHADIIRETIDGARTMG